jgi:hypothetical protein
MSNLETLFEEVRKTAYYNKKNDRYFDGNKFWEPLKNLLNKSDISGRDWKSINKNVTKQILSLIEFTIDGHGNKKIIELNHHIIQHIKIPLYCKPTLKRILQVAMNIGQFQALVSNGLLEKLEYKEHKLYDIKTYISEKDIKNMSFKIQTKLMHKIQIYLSKS